MKLNRFFKVTLSVLLLLSFMPASAFALPANPSTESAGTPLGYLTTTDGRQIPVYLLPENRAITARALKQGLITEKQVSTARALERSAELAGVEVCPFWTGSAATMISQGWDYDNDWYEDYEHPVGWTNDIVCVTAFYYATKGSPAHEYYFDYKPNIARHRLKVGLSGFPDWFAAAQTTMRWR